MAKRISSLALTIGDPAGIGPEITASVMNRGLLPQGSYIIGQGSALRKLLSPEAAEITEAVDQGQPLPVRNNRYILIDTGSNEPEELPRRATEAGGRVSGRSVELAIDMARKGVVQGIVTGPISKEALSLAGYSYRGHTDMLADLFDSPRCQMIMVNGPLRVVIMTRDIPLSEVPGAVTAERIISSVRVTVEGLKLNWAIDNPSIAVAALNPHAGDGGLLGMEEKEIIAPALDKLREQGIDAAGPFPADTLFYRWKGRSFDACIAIYHDQGMIPFKMTGFENGVNMTIGLPVVRTSVCHGTAYDLAGEGRANPGSLEAALRLAAESIERRGRRFQSAG